MAAPPRLSSPRQAGSLLSPPPASGTGQAAAGGDPEKLCVIAGCTVPVPSRWGLYCPEHRLQAQRASAAKARESRWGPDRLEEEDLSHDEIERMLDAEILKSDRRAWGFADDWTPGGRQ